MASKAKTPAKQYYDESVFSKLGGTDQSDYKNLAKKIQSGKASKEEKSRYNTLINTSKSANPAGGATNAPGVDTTQPPSTQFGQDQKNQSPLYTGTTLNSKGEVGKVANAGDVNVQAPAQAATAQLGPANNVNALTGDFSQANETRGNMLGFANQLQQQASGQGPSLASLQLQQALDQSQKQNLSLARSANYINPAVGLRAALQANAQNQQQSAMAAAQGRVAEQFTAQQQLGSVLNNVQGGDITQAQTNLGAALQAQQNNQNANNQFALTQAGYGQQANLANMDAYNNMLQFASNLAQQNNQFNAGQINATSGQQAGFNTSAKNTTTQANASMANAKTSANAQTQSAGIYADATKYAADNQLQGTTQTNLVGLDKNNGGGVPAGSG